MFPSSSPCIRPIVSLKDQLWSLKNVHPHWIPFTFSKSTLTHVTRTFCIFCNFGCTATDPCPHGHGYESHLHHISIQQGHCALPSLGWCNCTHACRYPTEPDPKHQVVALRCFSHLSSKKSSPHPRLTRWSLR